MQVGFFSSSSSSSLPEKRKYGDARVEEVRARAERKMQNQPRGCETSLRRKKPRFCAKDGAEGGAELPACVVLHSQNPPGLGGFINHAAANEVTGPGRMDPRGGSANTLRRR